jgi:hypothetical protein
MMASAPELHGWVAQKPGIVTAKSVQILCRISHHQPNRHAELEKQNNGSFVDDITEISFGSPCNNDPRSGLGKGPGKRNAARYSGKAAGDRPCH